MSSDEIVDQSSEDGKSEMTKRAARALIEKYYQQLTEGCGDTECTNADCASSGKVGNLAPNAAAGRAIQLLCQKSKLCYGIAKCKQARINDSPEDGGNELISGKGATDAVVLKTRLIIDPWEQESFACEERFMDCIEECKTKGDFRSLRKYLGKIWSDPQYLNQSFLTTSVPMEEDLEASAKAGFATSKKQIWSQNETNLDMVAVRKCANALKALPADASCSGPLLHAMHQLMSAVEHELLTRNVFEADPNYVNCFLIALEFRDALEPGEFVESTCRGFCPAVRKLPVVGQVKLTVLISKFYDAEQLARLVSEVQQYITGRVLVLASNRSGNGMVGDANIEDATVFLKLLYYASMMGGEMEEPLSCSETLKEVGSSDGSGPAPEPSRLSELLGIEDAESEAADGREQKLIVSGTSPSEKKVDPVLAGLGLKPLYVRCPSVPFTDFYNDPLCEHLALDKDYSNFKENLSRVGGGPDRFSFMDHNFILTPTTKSTGLYYDHRMRMYNERRSNLVASYVRGVTLSPFLKLKVRRDFIIDDALVELEMIAFSNPTDLKKQLVVEFDGEQGVDEGGVSKEFFQLAVEEIFHPKYGLFVYKAESGTYWFNPMCFESAGHFTLIGLVIGLAIYNNVILDVQFPLVVYKKLMGKTATFHDLVDYDPVLYKGLCSLLEYEGDDIEDVFMQSFQITYEDCFGSSHSMCLLPDGDKICVNHSNKHQFARLYADFLLNESVKSQFKAFDSGFKMVTAESQLFNLFRPEELEVLVCGTVETNLEGLEASTEYDGGYSAETPVIKWFWAVVHAMSDEDKKNFLRFATGSHRVPSGGLAILKFVITRHGDDSDKLPSAHTCYNVLLLPEYSSKEKLTERLMKSLTYCKGFGLH